MIPISLSLAFFLRCNNQTHLIVILWLLQNLSLSDGVEKQNLEEESASSKSYLNEKPLLVSRLSSPISLFHNNNESIPTNLPINSCEKCRFGENGKVCSGHGKCDCSTEKHSVCRCNDKWSGDTCQYHVSKITCEKMRSCILCTVYDTGPLTEGDDCSHYCSRRYPSPLIVKTLDFQGDEHLCSFIHHNNTSSSSSSNGKSSPCRYFFKYGKIKADGDLDLTNFYIAAQQEMDCRKKPKFPHLLDNGSIQRNKTFQIFAKNYEETVKNSENDEDGRKSRFITVVIIYIFIALPLVTCVFALIYNFSNLPCGLCNIFRQPSSKYLRNVRPYPEFVVATNEQLSAL